MRKEYEINIELNKNKKDSLITFLNESQPKSITESVLERWVYKNHGPFIARITNQDGEYYFDFKQDSGNYTKIKNVEESKKAFFKKSYLLDVQNLFSLMNFKLYSHMIKNRTSFYFKNFKVEIDQYQSPTKQIFVEIEGQKRISHDFYNKILKLLKK